MGATVEFYILPKQQLDCLTDPFEELVDLPVADFCLHLEIPQDLDRLFQATAKHLPGMPQSLDAAISAEIWNEDDMLLHQLSDAVRSRLGEAPADVVRAIGRDWWNAFDSDPEPAFEALKTLREICRASGSEDSLVLFWGY